MEKERNEQVIFIKDLVFAVLYKWRAVLAVGLALALLLGGWKLLFGRTNISEMTADTQEELLLLQDELNFLQDNIEKNTNYLENSVRMNINPYAVATASAMITVMTEPVSSPMGTENTSYVDSLLMAYRFSLLSNDQLKKVAEETGLDSSYLNELITVSSVTGIVDGTLEIVVIHSDIKTAEEILTAIVEWVPNAQQEINNSVAEHNVACYKTSKIVTNRSLIKEQEEVRNNLREMDNKRKELVMQIVVLGSPEQDAGNGITKEAVKDAIIFAVVGAVLGTGAVAVWAAAVHILGAKVYSERTLKAWTGIRVLGCIPQKEQKNKLDRWLRKLEGRSVKADYAWAAAAIRNHCPEKERLLICTQQPCDPEMIEALQQEGVCVHIGGYLTEDAEAMKQLRGCDSVLLMVHCGSVGYDCVLKQMQVVADGNKTLAGCILLDK